MTTRLILFLVGASSFSLKQDPGSPLDPDEVFTADPFDMPVVDLSAPEGQSVSALARPTRSVDAWLIMCHADQTLRKNMYTPILLTVQAGLAGFGKNVQIVDQWQVASVPNHVRAAVASGKKPLVFAVAIWWASANTIQAIRESVSAGAYVVLYQTEPGSTERMLETARTYNASEIWDYNMANIDAYPNNTNGIAIRYVPPGYLAELTSGSRVNMRSAARKRNLIGFVGNMKLRPKTIQRAYARILGGRVRQTDSVWAPARYVQWVEKFPLQLNTFKHQTCCPRTSAPGMTSFRMSLLLSVQACVLSAPVYPKDAELFANIVHFAEVEQTRIEADHIIRNGTRNCQSAAHALYKERFQPRRLLEQSGFLAAWQP